MTCRSLSNLAIIGVVVIFGISAPATADLTAIGPFTGDVSETFNQHTQVMAVQSLPVFGGAGALENLSAGGAIKVEFSSSLGGDLVVPMSGMMAGQLGIAQWTFATPVARFGGWWENNSGSDDATLVFYDDSDLVIGEMIASVPADAQSWTWNGWESTVPISRIEVTGNGLFNGFLWYENMQIDFALIPAPPAAATMIAMMMGFGVRRARRK